MRYWPHPVETNGVCNLPGIYRWLIDGAPVYVGRFTHASRPLKEYHRNVERLLNGKPYRPRKPDGFRRIHKALAEAVTLERTISIEIVENVEPELLNIREKFWIEQIEPHLRLNGRENSCP